MAEDFQVTALVLAGGAAQRMGGRDKGWQMYMGQPLIEYAVSVLRPVSQRLIVSANRNVERYQELADRVVCDIDGMSGIGPLGGMLAALPEIGTSHLLVLPCDTPGISSAALSRLLDHAQKAPDKIHYLVTDSGVQPLHAVLPVKPLRSLLADYLANAERFRVMAFYRTIGAVEVYWEKDEELENINFSEQLKV